MTPVDGPVRAAVQRADVRWLCAHLGSEDCTPAVLNLLVRHDDTRLRHLGLVCLDARIGRPRADETELVALAGLLPDTVDGPPETALVLARIFQRLWRHVPRQRRPRWRAADLPARARIAWLRAEIVNQPTTVRHEPARELLYQAVGGINAVDAYQLEELVRELTDSNDPVLQAAALRLAREGLHGCLMAPVRARQHILRLLDTTNVGVAVAALRELAEPWAALGPFPRQRLAAFVTAGLPTPGPAVIEAALAAAARHGHGDLLRDVVVDEDLPPQSRQWALQALGDLAGRDDIAELTAIAAADPLLLGRSAVACLRAMHRRGLFPSGDDAAAIVALTLADHTISAGEVATVVFTCRREAFRALTATGADDPTWPRRLSLLVGLAEQGSDDLPIGGAITDMLAVTSRPEPFLIAIRALRHAPAETAVIDALPQAPVAALHALEAIGGHRTVAALQERLGLIPPGGGGAATGVIAPYLRPVRHRAVEMLWHLTDDPDRRRTILAHLNPRDLPNRIAVDLGGVDQRELALLAANFEPNNPTQALLRLARNGDASAVAAITDLLLRIVADLAAAWEPDSPVPPADAGRRDGRSAGEPAVPDEVVAAIHALGHRLHGRGKIRPVCLLDAANAAGAGHALVASVALDLLDRADLSDREQTILLALLLRAPFAGTRARVHRLLRHRDRHVRKHAIALLAADGTGVDAQALSASLTALTAARDVQTVRQALLALGHARASWAAPAIAACLDHPSMNIKKTAAAVLVHAGTSTAAPKMLYWLGHHDNPGLRATLIEALRAILGDAYAATVVAAAEQASDGRTRELLLDGLGRALSASAVNALAQQQSPVGPTLLALVAAGRVRLGCGAVEDLTVQLAVHGITAPATHSSPAGGHPDSDAASLILDGWNTEVALRVVDRHDREPEHPTTDLLRQMLANWLDLAGAAPATRRATLRFALRLCSAPWSTDEIKTFARAAQVLLIGLTDAAGNDRDDLIAVLEEVAPRLSAAEALDVTTQIRALPSAAAGHRSLLALLRRCGAVLTRADVEQSLAAARLGPNPWLAETDVLREAFAVTATGVPDAAKAWRLALEAAARTPDDLHVFRSLDDHTVPSRDRLNALIDAFPSVGQNARSAILGWMEALQPIDAPPWTLAEDAHQPTPAPRTPSGDDLDQPRSAALRERLLAMLDAPTASQRNTAARALRDWPELDTRQAVLRAFLHGRVDVAITAELADALNTIDETELRTDNSTASDADSVHDRVARTAFRLDPPDLHRLIPLLLEWWEFDGPATRASVERALHRVPEQADAIAESLRGRIDVGAWGFLDLISGRPLLRTPALTETCQRLRAEGRNDLADKIILVDGPLRHSEAHHEDSAALSSLRGRPHPPASPAATDGPARHELLNLIRTGHPEQIRRALTRLAEAHEDDRPTDTKAVADRDPELAKLLAELLHHPKPRLRLHAHRIGRRILDHPTYLRHTVVLLDDPEPDVVRSAVKTLCHAAHEPAIPAIVGLLGHPHAGIRRTAADGLKQIGSSAIQALRYAASHARPDKRPLYTGILDQIAEPATPQAVNSDPPDGGNRRAASPPP